MGQAAKCNTVQGDARVKPFFLTTSLSYKHGLKVSVAR